MDRGAWLATVHGVEKGRTRVTEQHFHFLSAHPGAHPGAVRTLRVTPGGESQPLLDLWALRLRCSQ